MWQSLLASLDFPKVIAIISLCVSLAGFILTLINSYFTWQNRKLALAQELRKKPALVCSIIHGFQKTTDKGRSYLINILINNPSDINNAVAKVDLSIEYVSVQGLQMKVKLRSQDESSEYSLADIAGSIKIPARIGAHESVSGWLHFYANMDLLAGMNIENFSLILTDTHDVKTIISPNLIQEYRHEVVEK